MTDSNTTPETRTFSSPSGNMNDLFVIINGPLKEFVMLRRAVNYLQAVPVENLGADGTEALTFILDHYSTYPKVGPVTVEFKGFGGDLDKTEDIEGYQSQGNSFVPVGADLEYTALKSFGIKLMTMVTSNASLHPDVLNALSEFKSYHNL
jgi:hypothetical protein